MLPDPRESQVRLTDIEDHGFISENVQIQSFPCLRTLFHQKEPFQGNGHDLVIHAMVLSRQRIWTSTLGISRKSASSCASSRMPARTPRDRGPNFVTFTRSRSPS